jgi:hypothetical protein
MPRHSRSKDSLKKSYSLRRRLRRRKLLPKPRRRRNKLLPKRKSKRRKLPLIRR